MKIEVRKAFEKNFDNVKDVVIRKKVINIMKKIEKIDKLAYIKNIVQLKWFSKYYRIRVWNYRIWLKYTD